MKFSFDFDRVLEIFKLVADSFVYGWQWFLALFVFIVYMIGISILWDKLSEDKNNGKK